MSVFLKESFVSCEFFRGACNTNGDFFYDSRFDGNINFDSGVNVGRVAFFKSIGGRDRVFELVYMLGQDEILSFDCTYGGLTRRARGFL
jgi:hypothetical protein